MLNHNTNLQNQQDDGFDKAKGVARFHIANRIPSPVERRFRLSCLSLVLLGCFHQAQANPTLPQVVFGQASFATQGKTLTVTNSPNAIINWNSFSIANGETTRFVQQSASSAVLNRITGQHPSQIFGSLQSNGQVLLINPNGIVFGRGAQVDVRGLVASSLDISNQDFLNGRKRFKASDKAGKVHNAGSLNTANGGQIFLIAPQVENSGIINAPGGQILLAAGRSVQLVDSANPDLHVVVSAPEDQALNLGQIVAQAGKIGIYGALIKQRGSVQADSAVLGEGGKIVLKASRDTLLEAGSVTTVRNSLGQGGQIEVLGNRVGMMGDALLDASGLNGGGTVLVGGDYQGQPLVNSVNAAQTWLGPQAVIRADATEKGDGGKIVMWGERSTQAYGSLSARGGLQGGNGGLIETSARANLDVGGVQVDARSRSGGQNGRWLLDPTDVTVAHGSSGSLTAGMFDPSASATIGDTEINYALNNGTDVTIQTSGGTGGTGLIRINGTGDANGAVQIVNSSGGARSLSFNTSGTIDFRHGASLSASGSNQLSVNFNAGTGITLSGDVDANGGTTTLGAAASFYGSLKNTTLHTPHKMVGGSGVFDQIKLGSDLLSEGSFVIDNGITLDSGVTWDIGQSGLYFGGGSNVYLDSPGLAQVKMAGGFIYAGYQRSGQTLQVGADVSISGHGYIGSSSPSNLKNLGTIKSDLSGHTLTLATTGLDNQGKLQADAGYLTINKTTWSNSGSISVAGGATLSLQFDTTTAGLGTISNNGGTVNYSGTLDNSNAILDIGKGGVFGGLADFSGKLNGGSIKSGDGTALHGTTTLDSVKVLGTLEIQGSTFVSGNLTLADGATLNMKNSGLYFTSSGTPHLATDGKGTLNLDSGYLYGGYNTNDQQVQIDAGVTVQGHGAISNSSQVGFHNLGTIDANVSNHLLTVNPASLINSGTIKATGGSLTLNPISWTNSGVLQVTDGTLTLNLNTTTAAMGKVDRSGGEVHFSGKLDNSNDSLDIGSGGIFGGLSGLSGTVTGGSIFSGDGAALKSNSATLDGVTLSGNLELTGSAFIANNLNLADKAALKLNTGNLYFKDSGSTHLCTSGSAEVELVNGYIMAGYGATGQSLNIAPGVTIRGHGSLGESSEATINLGGTLKVDQSGQTLHVTSHVFNNTGSIQAQGGTLTLNPDSMPQAGTMAVGSGGTINLNFDTTTAALPTITRSGGTVNFNGKLDNSNNTLELGSSGPFGSGGLSSLGGTISGGKIQNTDLNLLQSNSAYLDNVTLAGKLELKGNTFIKQDLLLADGAQIVLNNSGLYFVGSDTRHVQSGGSSTLTLDGGNLYAGYGVTGQTLQIGKGVSIEGSGYISNSSPALLVNGGSIHVNSKDHTLHLSTKDFQNKGLLKVSDGTLEVQPAGSFSNSGTLQVDGGVLKLDLNTTTANLPNLVRNGGKVYLDGTLDNSNASLDIGGAGPFGAGGLTQLSGVVKDGSILSGDGSKLHASSLTLDNVSLTGQMSMDGNITVLHDLSLAPGANISIDNFGGLYFSSKGTQNLHSTGNATLNFANAYLYTGYGATGQTVKIGSGITLQGYGHLLQSSSATLENAGLIHANTAGETLAIQTNVFNNSGTLKVSDGTLYLQPQNWSNSGTLLQSGGEIHTYFATSAANLGKIDSTGGKFNLYGAFDNSNQVLDLGAGGLFGAAQANFFNGIQGGTIKSSDSATLRMNGSSLDGVTIAGDLHMSGVALVENNLTLQDGAQFYLDTGYLYFKSAGTQHIASPGNAKLIMDGSTIYSGYGVNGQTLQIDSGVSINGHGQISHVNPSNLINAGKIEASDNGQTLSMHADNISNTGMLKASNGSTLMVDGLGTNDGTISLAGNSILQSAGKDLINNGRIEGSGSLKLSGGSLTNNGVLAPGGDAMVGKLTIGGNLQQGSGGSMQFEVGPAANNSDAIDVSGSLSLNGTLNVAAINGYTPQAGDKYGLMTYSGSPSGNFATTQAAAFPSATLDVATAGKMVLMMPSSFLNVWNFDGSGNWDDPSKWSLGHVPLAHEDVQVPDYSSQFTLNIGSNAHTVKSVVFLGNDKLAMSGGSLSLVNNSSLQYGVLEMGGNGILNLGGNLLLDQLNLFDTAQINLGSGKNLDIQHYFQSGGSLSGAGNLLIQQAYSRSAGTIGSDLSSLHITQKNGNLLPGKLDVNGPMSLHAENGDIRLTESVSVSGKNSMMLEASGKLLQSGGTVNAEFLSLAAGSGINGQNMPLQIKAGHLKANMSGDGHMDIQNVTGNVLELAGVDMYHPALQHKGIGSISVENKGAALNIGGSVLVENGNLKLSAEGIHVSDYSFGLEASHLLELRAGNADISLPTNAYVYTANENKQDSAILLDGANLYLDGSVTAFGINGKSLIKVRADTLQLGSKAALNSSIIQIGVRTEGRPITLGSATCASAPCLALANMSSISTQKLFVGDFDKINGNVYNGSIHIHEVSFDNTKLNSAYFGEYLNLSSGGDITQTNPIENLKLRLEAQGNIHLNELNKVDQLFAQADGSVTFKNEQNLFIGDGDPLKNYGIKAGGDVHLQANEIHLRNTLDAGKHQVTLISSDTGILVYENAKVKAGTLNMQGNGTFFLTTEISQLSFNSPIGNAYIFNEGELELQNLTQGGSISEIYIMNKGKMTVKGAVSTEGNITLIAQSPLQIDGSVTSSGGGAILLQASANGGTDDVLSVGPSAVIQSTGKVVLSAGNEILIAKGSSLPQTVVLQANQNLPPTKLPNLNDCISNPALSGCSSVLPDLQTCTANPAAPGCMVVLPNLATCVSAPATPGCSVVLPNLATCVSNPAAPGCSVVLPTLATCMASPALPGCSVVLPSIALCTSNPTAQGCSVVLPNLASCISNPTTPGCSAVLPSLTSCMAAPATPGCNVVLPDLAACISNPSTPACAVVLPTLATCSLNPATPGCSAVLPSLSMCTQSPSLPGCSAVLPNLSTCIANPASPGCNVILPTLASCTVNPATPGCSVVLPNIAACMSNPSLPGCTVVLPSLASCISSPSLPGCGAILPSLASCIATPASAGCNVVLPSVASCSADPALPGCSVVLPQVNVCITNPNAEGCKALPNETTQTLSEAVLSTNNLVTTNSNTASGSALLAGNNTDTGIKTANTENSSNNSSSNADSNTGNTGTVTVAGSEEKKSGSDTETKKEEKKEEKKAETAKKEPEKKEEPARKLYCN